MEKKIKGYTLISEADVPDYDGHAMLWRHDGTGFRVITVKNDQKEQFFSYVVYTPPFDDTGVFHILEHSVLSGSEKYPVKEAFNEAMKKGCPTFMNAMTGVDKTYYLASSAIRKDFDNIFSVYTDAVFKPLLRKETFLQEGIRIMTGPEPHFEGVVFSEMNGVVSSHENVASYTASRNLFPDTPYIYESGGDPESIATLKYDDYVRTYNRFYSPSNMSLLLFGDVDIEEKLTWLDENYLAERVKTEVPEREPVRDHWTEPRELRKSSMAGEDAEEGDSTVLVSWGLGDSLDRKETIVLSILVDLLLGNPGCPLYRRIVSSDLGKDLSSVSGMDNSFRSLLFCAGFSGAKEENSKEIEKFILDSLREIAEQGFDPKEIEAALRRYDFSLKEIKGGAPQGLRALFRIDGDLAYGRNPIFSLFPKYDMWLVRKEVENDPKFFEKWIVENLVDNPHRLLSVIVQDPDEKERQKESLAEILKREMELVDPNDENIFRSWAAYQDRPEDLECFKALTNDDVPEMSFEPTPGTAEQKIVTIPYYAGGVVYWDIAIDVSDFSVRELEVLNLYARLLTMCSVGEKSLSEFQTDMRFSTGGYTFSLESGTDMSDGKERAYFMIRMKLLPEGVAETVKLLEDLLRDGALDETEVRNALTDISTEYQSGVIGSGHMFSITAAGGTVSPGLFLGERLAGVSFWLTATEMMKDIPAVIEELKAAREKMLSAGRMQFQILADEENMKSSEAEAQAFLASFPDNGGRGEIDHPVTDTELSKAYAIPGGMNYCGAAVPLPECGPMDLQAGNLLMQIVSPSELWDRVRAKGGAYGAGGIIDPIEKVLLFYSYRDPRIEGTYSDYRTAVEEEVLTEEKLEQVKLSERSKDYKPLSPGQKATLYMKRRLFGITDDIRKEMRKDLLEVSMDDLDRARDIVLSGMKDDMRLGVIGDRKALDASSLGLETKSLPF